MPQNNSAPLIVRLAGLPCDVIENFSTQLGPQVATITRLETELKTARVELVNSLFAGIGGAHAEKRHALLAVKRDCHNNRSLTTFVGSSGWKFVEEIAGEKAAHVLELEQQLHAEKSSLVRSFDEETKRQSSYLAALLQDPMLASGLAIASRTVSRESYRLREKPPENYGRREKKLVTTLLRYISRATLKLSPFSTFTAVGVAELREGAAPPALYAHGWKNQSLVRLRRNILDRCSDILLMYGPWREQLQIVLNDSVSVLPDGRLLYRRPSYYQVSEEEAKLRYYEESLVRVDFRGPLVERVKALLGAKTLTYGELKSAVVHELGSGASVEVIHKQLDRLISVGFLRLVLPWNSDDGHLEKAMLHEFRKLASHPESHEFLGHLQRLVDIEEGFLDAPDPTAAFEQLDELVDLTLKSAAALSQLPERISVVRRVSEHEIYQDLWRGSSVPDQQEILYLGRSPLEEALRNVGPLADFSHLYDHRLEFLLTLGAHVRQNFPDRPRVPVLEIFNHIQPLWKDYVKFQVQGRNRPEGWRETWDPLDLAVLRKLAQWRDSIYAGLPASLVRNSDGQHIDLEQLRKSLADVPGQFLENVGGACLFLQPASHDGSLWMLNRLKEGTGRFASRYTPLMPAELQEQYCAAMASRGTLEYSEGKAELLDIYAAHGDTLNVHAIQTPSALALDAERLDIQNDRRLALKDLFIVVKDDGWPRIENNCGRRYIPVYLGVGYHDYLSSMVKFLCAFGPTEMSAIFPPPWTERQNGILVQHRTTAGNVVVHRKTWTVPLDSLRACFSSSDAQTYIAVQQWIQKLDVPERVFAIERVSHPIQGSRFRPQYVDFSSPLFLPVLRSIISCPDPILTLVEMLPTPECFPRDANGEKWAIEILVDSLAMQSSSVCVEEGASALG